MKKDTGDANTMHYSLSKKKKQKQIQYQDVPLSSSRCIASIYIVNYYKQFKNLELQH